MNKKLLKLAAALLCLALLCACSKSGETAPETGAESGALPALASGQLDPEYTERDLAGTWDESAATGIVFSGVSAEISGSGASFSDGTLTITAEGVYALSGALDDGQVVVSAPETAKVQIVLNGVSISCFDSAAINAVEADKVFITLAEGTANTLSDGAGYDLAGGADEPDGCVFSKCDLTINGAGALVIEGNYNHGVHGKDELKITGGDITVTAANDALKGRDCVAVCGGKLNLTAGGDAIQSNNDEDASRGWASIDGGEIAITAGGDGIQAETVLQVTSGALDITTGGGAQNGANAQSNFGGDFGGFGGQIPPEMGGEQGGLGSTPPDGFGGQTPPDGFGGGQSEGSTPPDGFTGGQPDGTGAASATTFSDSLSAAGSAQQSSSTSQSDGGYAAASDSAAATSSDSFKGLKASGALNVYGGDITVNSADDSVHSNGGIHIVGGALALTSGDDGIHADAGLVIDGGKIAITNSYEGVEGMTITINGGDIDVTASDDGYNAAGGADASSLRRKGANQFASQDGVYIKITGGYSHISAGGDGIDSNGDLLVSGGVTLVDGPTSSGNGALDFNGAAEITGGVVIAAGAVGMAENLTGSGQVSAMITFTSPQSAGTAVSLTDESGAVALSYAPQKSYQSVVMSAPALKSGSAYTLVSGGSASDADQNGYARSGSVSGGVELASLAFDSETVSLTDTGAAGSGGMGDMGGGTGKR